MNTPCIIFGIGSLAVGALFIVFPKAIGVWFNRMNRSVWERHQDDLAGQVRQQMRNAFPAITPDYNDDAKAGWAFRLLGIVFLIQAVVFFLLSAVLPNH